MSRRTAGSPLPCTRTYCSTFFCHAATLACREPPPQPRTRRARSRGRNETSLMFVCTNAPVVGRASKAITQRAQRAQRAQRSQRRKDKRIDLYFFFSAISALFAFSAYRHFPIAGVKRRRLAIRRPSRG